MHAISLLKNWLESNQVFAHQYRQGAVVRTVDALLNGGRLSLTHLGRHRPGHVFVKHPIKAVDRLLDNKQLRKERVNDYATLARQLLHAVPRPPIIVDWADCELAGKGQTQLLRELVIRFHRKGWTAPLGASQTDGPFLLMTVIRATRAIRILLVLIYSDVDLQEEI